MVFLFLDGSLASAGKGMAHFGDSLLNGHWKALWRKNLYRAILLS